MRLFLAACALAATVPLLSIHRGEGLPTGDFRWPSQFQGRALRRLPLSERELRFQRSFPGEIARFSDGEREIVVRQVRGPTRFLHPSSDCFRGLGYRIIPQPLDQRDGAAWACFEARRGSETLLVRERIEGADGKSWTDVSAWYWTAAMGKARGPWSAVTVAEKSTRLQ